MGQECGVECSELTEQCGGDQSCGSAPVETAAEKRRAMLSSPEKAAEKRRLVVESSPPVELHSPCEFTLHAHEANTVLEVLEIRAEQIGLPKTAAAFLKMEFAEAIVAPYKTLEEMLGVPWGRGQVIISVHGEHVAKTKVDKANKINIHNAMRLVWCGDNFQDVKLVLAIYPEKANLKHVANSKCTASLC